MRSTRCIDAHYQHEGLDLHHPHGGQALYLSRPLFANYRDYYDRLGRATLEPGGLTRTASDIAEDLAREVAVKAPIEWGDLRKSGHPQVTDDGATVYDRPPEVHRLTEEELRAKHRRGLPGV